LEHSLYKVGQVSPVRDFNRAVTCKESTAGQKGWQVRASLSARPHGAACLACPLHPQVIIPSCRKSNHHDTGDVYLDRTRHPTIKRRQRILFLSSVGPSDDMPIGPPNDSSTRFKIDGRDAMKDTLACDEKRWAFARTGISTSPRQRDESVKRVPDLAAK